MNSEDTNVTIARMQEDIKHTAEAVDRVEEKLDKFIEASEEHFAAKWTETALRYFLVTIAGLIITYTFIRILGLDINSLSPF